MSKDGGPAFPQQHAIDGNWVKEPLPEFRGMTMRDWFAGNAMRQMLPWNHDYPTEEIAAKQSADFARLAEMIAKTAYLLADAMLAERERK